MKSRAMKGMRDEAADQWIRGIPVIPPLREGTNPAIVHQKSALQRISKIPAFSFQLTLQTDISYI
jgi:hypothetical protein